MAYEIIEDDGYLEPFKNIQFPIVRRVFPSMIANQLVSIQPMTMPTGNMFYLDYIYDDGAMKTAIEESEDIRVTLTELIRKDSTKLLKVVKEHFPMHLELLEKLLVLK